MADAANRTLTEFTAALLARCNFPPASGGAVTCAVSGGADSLALLYLARAHGLEVTAVHVDHGIREGSQSEAAFVERAASELGAGFRALRVQVTPGANLEERARRARYGVLPPDALLGHTADDQAETVLLALARGGAWHGLGGMRPSQRRPILGLRRADTEALCQAAELDVIDDPSNADPAHLRNRVRHELLPLLEDIAGRDLTPVLVRQAGLFRDGADLISALAERIDPADSDALVAAPTIVARQAVRDWIRSTRGDVHPVDLATVDRVLDVAHLRVIATEVGEGWRVERSNRRLRLVAPR